MNISEHIIVSGMPFLSRGYNGLYKGIIKKYGNWSKWERVNNSYFGIQIKKTYIIYNEDSDKYHIGSYNENNIYTNLYEFDYLIGPWYNGIILSEGEKGNINTWWYSNGQFFKFSFGFSMNVIAFYFLFKKEYFSSYPIFFISLALLFYSGKLLTL